MGGVNYPQTIITPGDDTVTPAIKPKVEFFGEDYFYTFPFAGIGHVKIQNDGYIWGGYEYNFDTNKMELHEALRERGPLEFGKIFENDINDHYVDDNVVFLIDLWVVAEYQAALEGYNKAETAAEKEYSAGRIRDSDNPSTQGKIRRRRDNEFQGWMYWYKNRVWLLINDKAKRVKDILVYTAVDDQAKPVESLPDGYIDEFNHPYVTDDAAKFAYNTLKCNSGHNFRFPDLVHARQDPTFGKILESACFDVASSTDLPITANAPTRFFQTEEFYYPIYNIKGGFIKHPLLDHINATPDGKIKFPGHVEVISISKQKHDFVLPFDLKIELTRDSLLNLEKYAQSGYEMSDNVLLITIRKKWWDYFTDTANLIEIRQLATTLGLTIRFRIQPFENDKNRFAGDDENITNSDIFFLSDVSNEIDYFKTNRKVAPFKYQLKDNLKNPDIFEDSWRDDASFMTDDGRNVYGFYPLNEDVQLIAYNSNSDYLPTGLDFDSKPQLYEHLVDTSQINDTWNIAGLAYENQRHKNALLVPGSLSSPIWANNYYSTLQRGQQNNDQQDIVWEKENEEKAFYTVFKDAELINNPKFKAWVDHYKSAQPGLMSKNTQYMYANFAFFNEFVAALMVNTSWINKDWRNGEWRDRFDSTKATFAESNFRFQALPETAISPRTRWFAAFTSEISDKKQQLAEAFLAGLTSRERVVEFNHELAKVSARKDIDWNTIDDPLLKSLALAKENTKTFSWNEVPNWARVAWRKTINGISNTSTYQKVRDEFLEVALESDLVDALYSPVVSSS